MNATIILLSGDAVDLHTWQRMYNLTPGSSQIGRYFNIGEPSFRNGLTISEAVIRFLDMLRFHWGKPINIASLDRTEEYQKNLRKTNPNAALKSPHVVKCAADIDTISQDETFDMLEVIDDVIEMLGYQVRIGWKSYMKRGNTFIHIDVCPMYYRPGKAWYHKDHPRVWENSKGEW